MATSAPHRCPDSSVSVDAVDPVDFDAGCRGAAAAREFLAASGLETNVPIEISFVEAMPGIVADTPSVGCYVRADNRIYLLTFARCQTLRLPHQVAVDRSVHTGLVAHEVAHRILAANATGFRLSTVAHEYIAYVTMYATMPEGPRQQVLKQIPGEGYVSEREIDLTLYLIDPFIFGAQAYRHFLKPGIGRAYLARILNHEALVEDEPR